MKGDIILVEEHHRRAAAAIVARLLPEIESHPHRYLLTVAGESGSGKSETAQAIAEALAGQGVIAAVLQQDDYFHHPPKTNDRTRRADIDWVGPGEVRLDLLDSHMATARNGAATLTKPLVIYTENRIDTEKMSLEGINVVLAEGTYTSLLDHVDRRIFIDRNRLDTLEHRMRRGREGFDPFIERVLEIEHAIISEHKSRADVVISKDYDVEFPGV
jgi:uridine kinase